MQAWRGSTATPAHPCRRSARKRTGATVVTGTTTTRPRARRRRRTTTTTTRTTTAASRRSPRRRTRRRRRRRSAAARRRSRGATTRTTVRLGEAQSRARLAEQPNLPSAAHTPRSVCRHRARPQEEEEEEALLVLGRLGLGVLPQEAQEGARPRSRQVALAGPRPPRRPAWRLRRPARRRRRRRSRRL